ncbi:hypothetical protein I6F65_02035 [Pseudoalteromonas sp. SWXJZ94C]|uniref:VpsP family polysaccharide biosynthesis protein n=1 Tax=Pseudoalteromonas sp. SWXJZ94C TaxID=2792065 RepID=UPI0018CFCFAF|nr:hypothetical protein [Pseudoalteromonas sp. SWXJZ94C]
MIDLKHRKFIQIGFLAIITLIICYSSIQSMRANAWYFNALNTLKQLPLPLLDNTELALAENAIKIATELEPTQPHYWQLYAYIKMRLLSDTKESINDLDYKNGVYKQAEQALLKSVDLRQSWPDSWIELAKVTSYQEGASDRVYTYIQQAKKIGPFNFEVHAGAIQIALMNWHALPPKYKALYVQELKLAVKHGYKFNQIFDVAKQVNGLPILCLSMQFGTDFEKVRISNHYKKYCRS